MSTLNKFGELNDDTCPECGKSVKSDWIICPICGAKIKETKEGIEPDSGRFICPGCQEKSTAKNGLFCEVCNAFVHYECMVKGEVVEVNAEYFSKDPTFQAQCPVCEAVLSVASYHEGNFHHVECIVPQVRENAESGKIKSAFDRFTCPGCGEASNAKIARMCKRCAAFVHESCLLPGPEVRDDSLGYHIAAEFETITWRESLCPMCQQIICHGYFENGKFKREA